MNWVNTGQDIDLFHNYAETWTMKYGFTINRTSWNILRAIISSIKQFESRNIFWNSGLCLLCYLIYSTSFIFERHKRLNLLIKHQGPDIITDILWTKEYTLIAMLDLLYILSIDFMYFKPYDFTQNGQRELFNDSSPTHFGVISWYSHILHIHDYIAEGQFCASLQWA